MVDFSQRIKAKYDVSTYEGTKDVYEWIVTAIKKLKLDGEKIQVSFHFYTGDIGCKCDSIEEFIEYAYGQDRYSLIDLRVMQRQKDGKIIIYASCSRNEVYLSVNDKIILEKVVKSLEETNIKQEDKSISDVNVHQTNYNIGSINGDNNTIIQGNENKIITKEEQKKESKLKTWTVAILQNLLANWIWLVIPLIFGVIAGVLTK